MKNQNLSSVFSDFDFVLICMYHAENDRVI